MKKIIFLLFFSFLTFGLYAQTTAYKIKVSSFNLRYENTKDTKDGNGWTNRCPVIANMILFHDLDIVGTQECKYNQIKDLNGSLNNYDYIGRGRDSKTTAGEYSSIFYKTDKYNLLNNGDFWLSKTPDKPSKSWDADMNRICSWGEFEEKATGFVFFVFNLHMDLVEKARKHSAKLVLEKIEEIAGTSPVVLTGDFNANQTDKSYLILAESDLISDCYTHSPIIHAPNGTLNNFDINRKTDGRIDHVFITKHFTPMRYGILTDIYWTNNNSNSFDTNTACLPSDHYPVVVELHYMIK